MDKRPAKRSRLWSGGAYDSDTEDPDHMKTEANDLSANSIMKVSPSAPKHLCHPSCLLLPPFTNTPSVPKCKAL